MKVHDKKDENGGGIYIVHNKKLNGVLILGNTIILQGMTRIV